VDKNQYLIIFRLTKHIVPTCIYPYEELPTKYFEVAGYGQDGFGLQTNKLLKVQLKLVTNGKCQETYGDTKISETSQMCANSYREDIKNQDTCYGDSGSGLQFMMTNSSENDKDLQFFTPSLVGITNFGIDCGTKAPGVYLKISNYIEWMESIILPL
jgi:secreted trypsin-like serine protease